MDGNGGGQGGWLRSAEALIGRAETRVERHARSVGVVLGATLLAVSSVGAWRAVYGSSDFDGFHEWMTGMWRLGEISAETRRYPPSFLAILSPLAALPLGLAAIAWMLLNVLALTRLPLAFERLTGVASREQWPAWLALSPVIVDNLLLAQSGPLLLWLVSEGLARVRRGRACVGGVLLATATLLKVLPAAFWAVLVARRRGAAALGGALLTLVPVLTLLVLAVGPRGTLDGWDRWWSDLWSTHSSPERMIETGSAVRFNNQALPIVLGRTLSRVEPRPEGAVQLASLPLPVSLGIARAILAALFLVGVACAWRLRNDDERSWCELYALVAIGALAAVPLVWTHYFLWVAPGLVALCRRRLLVLTWGLLFALLLIPRSCRALGAQMGLSIALYLIVAFQSMRADATPAREGAM